jgi:DNA-binding MarR family transcriptional regulator
MSSTRTETEREDLLAQLSEAGRRMSDAAVLFHTAMAARLGLGPSDWKGLGLLGRGPLSAGELSEQSGLAPASVTGLIDRLESMGLAQRQADPRDGRRVVVEMNRSGLRQMEPFFVGLLRRLDELYARYTNEQLKLIVEVLQEIAHRQMAALHELSEEPEVKPAERKRARTTRRGK